MSDPRSALDGARFQGLVTVEEVGLRGMITLRGDPSSDALARALQTGVGLEVPAMRGIALDGERGVAWMAPDELLVMVPLAEAGAALRALEQGLAGEFATVADVSHVRAVLTVTGRHWRDVLAKLCPVDFAPGAFLPGEIRRTRAAQVAVAIWMSGEDEVTLVCFRSVAQYMFDLLSTAARPGGNVGLYRSPTT